SASGTARARWPWYLRHWTVRARTLASAEPVRYGPSARALANTGGRRMQAGQMVAGGTTVAQQPAHRGAGGATRAARAAEQSGAGGSRGGSGCPQGGKERGNRKSSASRAQDLSVIPPRAERR